MKTNNKSFKVLIVDDELAIRETLGYLLKNKGFSVTDAENGKEALKKVFQDQPDLIILDVTMPEMDGLETFRQLRENTNTQDIPIIFLSSRVDIMDSVRNSSGGAVEYINKPCNIAYLIERINALLAG